MKTNGRMWFALAGAAILTGAQARADILTLKNNKVMKGYVEDEDATSVRFTQSGATLKIPKANIKNLQKEPKAVGYAHLGDDLRAQNKMDEAVKFYDKALKEDPNCAQAKDGLKAAQDAKDAKKKAMRQDSIQEIGGLIEKVKEGIRAGEFDKAERMLKEASERNPTDKQKPELKALVTELYLAWAKDYLDKFDKGNAEDKLNIALASDPGNTDVIEQLLKLWENQPEKKDEIVKIYETVLQGKPTDQSLRRKLGDLYFEQNKLDKAAYHYLEVYKSSKAYKGSPLEARLVDNLGRLHAQYAQQKDFDKAIYYHDLLSTIDPKTDPNERIYYEYLKLANKVKPDDLDGKLTLAKFAEENGMEQQMLDTYRFVAKKDPENKGAREGLDRYAMGLVAQAQNNFNAGDYYTAKGLADRVMTEFPAAAEAKLKAQEIAQSSSNEIANDKRAKREQALQYVKRGDTYYEQAMGAYNRILDVNYQTQGTRLSSPKNDAIRYFTAAVQAYEASLQLDPTLKSDPGQFVAPRLDESRQFLRRLTAPPPAFRTGYGNIIDPDRSYSSHIDTP